MADTPKAFEIEAKEDVEVMVDESSEDPTFRLAVRKGGEEVEVHEGVTAESITTLSSDHFSARHIDPPSAPAD